MVRGGHIGSILIFVLGLTGFLATGDLRAQTPPPAVEFYGQSFCGENFVFCLDRSASMSWNGHFPTMIAETGNAISSLSPTQSFSIVAFSDGFSVFSSTPVPASIANIDAALQWLAGLTASGSTCLTQAVVQSISILDNGPGTGTVLLVGDGVPACGSTPNDPASVLAAITGANFSQHAIATIYLGSDSGGIVLYQQIALQNPGNISACLPLVRRGDANGDGSVDLADAIAILGIPTGGAPPPLCEDAADANDDGVFQSIPDAIALLNGLFLGGPIPAPFPDCGPDPTADALPCIIPVSCP